MFNFPEVSIVEASAGSGKTYALAKRYVGLLINTRLKLGAVPLRSILAITFTNKATVEMKERILELLKRIALDVFPSQSEKDDILKMLSVDEDSARTQAGLVMEELIKHYNFFQIQTIDSFINALLLGCALNIDRSAGFKIKRDYSSHLLYCFDLVVEQAAVNKEVYTFLEEFLSHYLFVENKKGWFPKEDILELIKSLFKLTNKYGRLFFVYEGKSIDVINKKKSVFNQIEEISSRFPEGMNGAAKKHIRGFLENNDHVFKIADLPAALNTENVPLNKGGEVSSDFKKDWEKTRKALIELIELDATIAYNPYIKLFQHFLDFFQRVSKEEDVLFLEELNCKARLLFGEEGVTVAELYYRLAARFKHYLIDEFQDTSVLQWRNLEMMIEEALSTGGSLFYVGDKKQAIYRFRGGEVKLFDEVRDKFVHFNVKHSRLTKNWRSQKAIVEFNNTVFSLENIRNALSTSGVAEELDFCLPAVEEIAGIFEDSRQEYKNEFNLGYVQVERIEEKNQFERNEIIREKLFTLIKELRERCFAYEDMAVLTRDNREVELVTAWFLEADIPVESEKTLNLMENPLIKEIISFLNFLDSPIDDLNFASFILGEIFSRSSGIDQETIREFIFSLRRDRRLNQGTALYRLFREEFAEVWSEYIDNFFKSVGFISAYELLVSIYQRFLVLEHFTQNQAFFMKLLELVKAKEDDYAGLTAILLYLKTAPAEDLYVTVTHSDSIKILTIHKAKGLEFPVVIIPFLRMDINPESGGKGTASYVVGADSSRLGLLRITKNHRMFSSVLREIYARNYKNACIDELNNMYVALTRAQQEMYIFIPKKSGIGNNKGWFLIPQDFSRSGQKNRYEKTKSDTAPRIMIPPGEYKDWIEKLKDEFGDVSSIRNRDKIINGTILHFMFSCIGNLCEEDKKISIEQAAAQARIRYSFFKGDFSDMERIVFSLLEDVKLKPFFYVFDGRVYREKEVVNIFGAAKRIDRLIVKDGQVWIVDYKTVRDKEEKDQEQVREYKEIISGIYPDKEVKGFILYIEEKEVEEIKWTE